MGSDLAIKGNEMLMYTVTRMNLENRMFGVKEAITKDHVLCGFHRHEMSRDGQIHGDEAGRVGLGAGGAQGWVIDWTGGWSFLLG